MESARVSWVVRLVRGATVGAVSALLTFVSLLTPAPLFALHSNPTALEDGSLCSDCHNMSSNPGAVDAATSYLIANSRSLWNIKDANGGTTTAVIGCTYCHFNNTGTTMKGVTNHWTAISRHPIGETFDGTGARTNTKNEWLSSYAGDTSAASGELDCVDCHAQALVDDPLNGDHTTHVSRATRITSGNLYMLTGVTAAGEYDGFCRTCHGATAGLVKGIDVRVSSHNDGSDAGANAIKEADGTLLKTGANPNAKCSTCHVGHSSAGKKLFAATLDPSNGSKCTDCHENGDANNNFEAHGHGMNISSAGNALNFSCTGCHGVNTAHDPSDATINSGNPKMLDYSEDTSTSVYGKSLRSICKNCHDSTKYTAHTGGSVSVGCIDCHDEHGEGSGTGSNRYMIPQNLPNNNASVELSFFQSAGDSAPGEFDYWVADAEARKVAEGGAMAAATNAGLCDNSICHGASTPMNGLPLATFLNSGSHTGGPITPAALAAGLDCSSCHKHTDSGGTWAANQACTSCHGQPPLTQATSASGYVFSATPADESKTPHARHAVATPTGYGFACTECHYQNVSSPPHNEATNSYASVWFDPVSNPDATLYPTAGVDYVDGTYTCNNIYCHSDGQRRQAGGSQKDGVTWMTTSTTPDWNVTSLLCSDCHGATNNTVGLVTYGAPDHANGTGGHTANSHVKHPYACAVCHNGTTQDLDPAGGWTLDLAGRNHVNGAKNLAAAPGYAFTAVGTTPATCNNISCHGGNSATWGGASLSCDQCHFRTTAGGGDLNNFGLSDSTPSLINSDEWMAAGHGRTTNYPSGNVAAGFVSTNASDLKGCLYCHDAAVPHATGTNPFRLRNNNALAQGLTAANAFGWNDACLVCHSTLDGDGFDPDAAGAAYLPENAVKNIGQNHYGSKHSAGTQGGTFCWDCHDPHGDAAVPQYMLQGTTGGSPGNGVTQTSDGTYGIPVTSRAVTGFDSAAGGGTPLNFNSSDFVNASFTGLCQTCHTTALYYNQTTNTALTSHNGADTNRCTGCHQHTNDFGSACDTCHGNPPLPRPTVGTTQTWLSDNAAGTQGDHTAHATTYLISDCNNTCHVSTTHATNKTSASMGTRAATAAASTGVHKYSTIDNVDVWTGNTTGITSVVDDSCVNVSCHNSTYSANAYLSAANPTYVRYWNNTFDCYSCHAYDGQADSAIRPGVQTSVTADWIATGSHDQHINRNGYAAACTNCHDTTGYTAARAGNHGNGFVTFVTNFGATRAGAIATGGVYDANGATGGWAQTANIVPTTPAHNYYCGNVYCHSSGEPRGAEAIAYPATTQWTVAASGNCGTCHTVTGSALTTNVHEKHTGPTASSQYNYACQTCHFTVVDATPAIIAGGFALHVNGTNNAAFATNEGTYTLAAGTCTATYCHSQGLDWSTPFTTESSNLAPTTADWDIVQGTLGCGGCHGNPPSYANDTSVTPGAIARLKKNSHAKHSTFGCQYCHNGTTTNGTTIVATTGVALHGNKAWNLAAGGGESFTVTTQGSMAGDIYTATVCATISCHGNGGATWGQTLACSACHDGNGATVAENGGVLGDGNTTPNEVDQAQFTSTGHGRTTAYVSETGGGANNAGANLSCNSSDANNPVGGCHQANAAHVPASGTDPWRLTGGGTNFSNTTTATNGLNGLCLYCHPASGINTHDSDITGGGTNALLHDTKCIDCHDPHGDTNIFMMQGQVAQDSVGDNGTASDAYGMPESTVATSFTAWNPTANTSDLDLLAGTNQLCEVCHVGATTTGHNGGIGAPGHTVSYQGQNCISCHSHVSGFKGGGCDGCHGNGAGSNTPDSTPGDVYEDRAGSHAAHVAAIGTGNNSCDTCHPGNPPTGHPDGSTSPARLINHDADGNGTVDADAGSYKTLAGAATDSDGRYNQVTRTCANINCHGSQTTPAWYPDVTAPAWTPSYSITATGGVGFATLSWNAAVDAATPPVTYDIYASTTNTAVAVFTGPPIQTDVTGTSAVVSRSAGTWYFGVRAKDSKTPPNSTSGEGISAGAIVTAPAGACSPGTSTSYYGGLIGALPVISDGTYNPTATGGTFTTNATTFGRQPMSTTANATNQTYVGTMPTTGVFNRLGRFYLPALASSTCVGPNVTAGAIGVTSTANTDSFQVNLVDYDPAGAVGNGTILGSSAALAGTTVRTERTFTMTFAQTQVAAGHVLVMEVMGRPATSNNRLTVNFGGDATAGRRTRLATPVFVPTPEAVPPVWTGGISNIGVTNPNSDGRLSVTWNAATDATSPPVSYNLYRSSVSAADVWNNLVYSGLAATGKVDSGLTNGTTYWYGVRAVDRIGNATSNDAQTASGIPSAPGSGCTLCHGIPPAAAGNAGSHAAHANSDADYTDCNKCHPGTTGYTTAHSDGVGQLAFDGSAVNGVYGAGLTYTDGAVIYNDADGYGTLTGTSGDGIDDGTCSGTGTSCHSAATPQWGNAATVVCGSCHGTAARGGYNDPSTDDDGAPPDDTLSAVTGTRVGKHLIHLNVSYGHTGSSCGLCHLNAGSGTAAHADGTASGGGRTADVAFNTTYAGGTATFTTGAPPTCTNLSTTNCHSGSANWDTAAPAMLCTQCHTIGAGKHMAITKGGADQTCTACHPGGTSYPTRHSKNANANVIEIPTNTVVGITASPGIHLGGDHTATKAIGSWGVRPTTEAEMCWFCHDQSGNAVLEPATEASEWSSNFGSTYNEGSISTARWIGATWTSAQTASPSFAYKSAVINPDVVGNSRRGSIHTAMTVAQGGPTDNYGDTTAQIRCSYCHDVHDFNKATGDTTSGRPWLRGQWKASPYKQDGAPQSGTVYPPTTPFGAVPRARTINTHSMGGYWIDQNSNSPASAWTPAVFGGLCALCHDGTPGDDQDWTSAEIGTINVFGTMSDWVSGNNGHANSVKGGAGGGAVTARNIYNARGGTSAYATNGFAHFQGMTEPGNNGNYGFREGASFYTYTPSTNSNEGNPTGTDQWGVDETGATLQNNYHQFPCSKCHVPHASRLPRLMKTNCLDTKQNTWDNTYQLSAATGNNLNRSISNWTSAQNCHRRGGEDPADVGDSAGTGAGWNNVTPW